jgi:DNA-directed RNA polymerase subunit RPC12/RpoP
VDAVCSLCGRTADPSEDGDPPLSWSADIVETSEGHRTRWVCTNCTRRFVRSIEAKLDLLWW